LKNIALPAILALVASSATLANDDVLELSADPANNVMPSITYNGWNYSQLDQINLDNVKDLRVDWTFQLGVSDESEAQPLVVGDTMYVVTPKPNRIYALDLNDYGTIKWEFRADSANLSDVIPMACCGAQTRGLNYAEGKLFFQALGGHVYALDAETGDVLWDQQATDIQAGETMVGNGIVIKDLYIAGMAGGEYGARGYVVAFDINSGEEKWRFYSMGPNADVGIGPKFKPFYAFDQIENPAEASWYEDSWKHGGGTNWGFFTYDPELNMFYHSTGNCGPWNPDYRRPFGELDMDENGIIQSYRSNYCSSLLARDADTGELIWAYNLTPQDQWDLDEPNINPLADIEIDGVMHKAIIRAARNGYFYVWDRETGELLNEPWPFVHHSIFKGVDTETGSPMYNIEAMLFTHAEDRQKYTESGALTEEEIALAQEEAELYGEETSDGRSGTEATICPTIAARNWENDAYSPRTGLLYTSVQFGCREMRTTEGQYVYPMTAEGYKLYEWTGEKFWLDREGNETDVKNQLQANDPVTGETVWSIDYVQPTQDPILATASDLLFVGGDDKGVLRAINATNGETVWEFRVGNNISASPVTYMHDGEQYIAVTASARPGVLPVAADTEPDAVNRYQREGSTLYVFKLPPQDVAQN